MWRDLPIDLISRSPIARWAPVPLRLIVGYGFMEHGFAKLARGLDAFPAILQALGVPAPHLMGWLTILVEIFGGLAVLLGALVPLASIPMAAVLLVAIFTVHLPYGFSSIKLQAVTAAGAQFGPPGFETDLLYLACLAALVLGGSGPLAIDGLLAKRREITRPSIADGRDASDMNAGFGSWLLGMSLGASALGGMLGMASGIFIVLAATTFGSALLYAISGFGFAVLAAPLFLLFLDPARAIQLVIIISTVLSIIVLRGLLPAIAPWLLLRLALGSLVGLPLGLVAFRYADPILVRAAAGAMIFGFAILMAVSRRRSGQPGQGKHWTAFAMSPGLDLAAGAVSGIASALVGQPGPPVLIYLLLAGAAARTVRATLLAFFALSYGVTLASHAATIGIPAPTWLAAGILIPFAFLGGLAGRPIGDRLGAEAFAMLAIALLAVAGAYTLGAAAVAFAAA